MVTPSALIGWLYHDGEDKKRFSVLPRITVASGGQLWPESLSWLLFRQPIHEFRASLVWERYAIMITCLLQWDFIHMGWADSNLCAVRLLLQRMQPIVVISQLHFWSNQWVSLYFSCLKWVKWGRQTHSPISEKEERETWVLRESHHLFSFYLKLF